MLWKCEAKCTGSKNNNEKVKWIDCNTKHQAPEGWDAAAQAKGSAECAKYYGGSSTATNGHCSLLRPLSLCSLPPGGGNGDPHMVTFDGLRFEFQPIGEFILATDKQSYNIQVRTEQYGRTQTSVQTAVTVKMGDVKVGVFARESPVLRINDAPAVINCPGQLVPNGQLCSGRVNFDNGAWLTYDASQQKFSIYLADEVSHLDVVVRPSVTSGYMNTEFFPGPAQQATTVGLIGSADKNRANDFVTRDGVLLTQPLSFRDMYYTFANSWRVSEAESQFTYQPGRTTYDFTNATFPGMQMTSAALTQTERDTATAICKAAGVAADRMEECILDAAVLGSDAVLDFVRITPAF